MDHLKSTDSNPVAIWFQALNSLRTPLGNPIESLSIYIHTHAHIYMSKEPTAVLRLRWLGGFSGTLWNARVKGMAD